MTSEEFQRAVLEKLSSLDSDVKGLKNSQNRFESEIQDVKNSQNRFESEIQDVKNGQNRFESEIKSVKDIVLKIENDHGTKLDALFDAREFQKEMNERIFLTLDRLEAKIDVLQMETAHIRRIK